MIIKKGFTLSEVMITIGLVGVLAAILIPATIKVTPSTNKLMAKKANYTIQKAIANMINDDKNYPGDVMFTATTVPQGFAQGTATQFCTLLADQMNTVGPTSTSPCTFTTSDGIVWSVPQVLFSNADVYTTYIVADVNPKTTGCTTDTAGNVATTGLTACSDLTASCKGNPDTFVFGVRYDGKIKISADPTLNAGQGSDLCLYSILSNPTDNQR